MPSFQRLIKIFLLAILCAPAGGGYALAQGKLDAGYVASLAGIPVGTGRWMVDIGDDKYSAIATGGTAGLLRVFAAGEGTSVARGAMIKGTPVPGSFNATITFDKYTEEFRMGLSGNLVTDVSITPPPPPNPDRIPLTDAHRQGVADPMTATLMRVPGNGNLMSPEACKRTLAVYDGRMRYDLQLDYKRVDQVSTNKGYSGASVVCAMTYVPIAGHNPQRTAIKYLVASRNMELWLAPIAGTRLVVPFRVSVPTPFGVGIVQATEFVTAAQPPHAATASSKSP